MLAWLQVCGEHFFKPRPRVSPWPPRAGMWNYQQPQSQYRHEEHRGRNWSRHHHDGHSRHDDWSRRHDRDRHRDRSHDRGQDRGQDRDRDSRGNNQNRNNNYNNRRYGHHSEPYRDLDDVREQKTNVDRERDEADDVAAYLDNWRKNHMEKKTESEPTSSPVKSEPEVKPKHTAAKQNGQADYAGDLSGSSSNKASRPDISGAVLDRYRVKPRADTHSQESGGKHHPLPHQVPSNSAPKKRLLQRAPPTTTHSNSGQTQQAPQSDKAAQKRDIAAAAARSQKAIMDAVKAAGGRSKVGAGASPLAKLLPASGESGNKTKSAASLSKPAMPPIKVRIPNAHMAVKTDATSPTMVVASQDNVSVGVGPPTPPLPEYPVVAAQPTALRLDDTKLLVRLPSQPHKSPSEEEDHVAEKSPVASLDEQSLKLTVRLPLAATAEKSRKHKKHKKHKHGHRDSPEHSAPSSKKMKVN